MEGNLSVSTPGPFNPVSIIDHGRGAGGLSIVDREPRSLQPFPKVTLSPAVRIH